MKAITKLLITAAACSLTLLTAATAYAADETGEANISKPKLYEIDSAVSYTAINNNENISLYKKKFFADINSDGNFSSADSRLLLRMALHLEPTPEDISTADINEDGKINTADARTALRAVLKLDKMYCTENGSVYSGFATSNGKDKIYLNKYGEMQTGYTYINGSYYFFDLNGIMKTGVQTIDGKKYYFTQDGSSAKGFLTVNGKKMYFADDGSYFTGTVKNGNDEYYYIDSLPFTGWQYAKTQSYYYKDGKKYKNTKMGYFTFDGSGNASVSVLNNETFDVYIRQILKNNGSSPNDIYNYVHNNFRYKYYDKISPKDMAIRILKNGRGACYDYAYLTHYLLEAAGYENKVIVGGSFNPANGNEHDWILYKENGVWRYMDTQRGRFNKTADQMRSDGYRWNESGLPPTI